MNRPLQEFLGIWLPKLDEELRAALSSQEPSLAVHYGMMHYHMGWVDIDLQPFLSPTGKRLRPMLCLLACADLGGDPVQALPAAVALEILHNFSLVHDDIEDGDETRRHRPTVWAVWGVPLAINTGDAMFALAYQALQGLARRDVSSDTTVEALEMFTRTNVALTEGQFLDMQFESRNDVSVDDYLRMIQGKTAALIGASVAIGGLVGGASPAQDAALQRFGQEMGLAFQIQDDVLGIWGDPSVTGKAAGNDILRRKKSLPLLYARNHPEIGPQLAALLANELTPAHLPAALDLLEQAGARRYAQAVLTAHHQAGLAALEQGLGAATADSGLYALSETLLHRSS